MQALWRSKTAWILLIAAALIVYFIFRPVSKSTGTILGKVSRVDLVQKVTIAGTVTPNHKSILSAPYKGYIHKIYVRVGQEVKTGDPIVSVTQSLRGSAEEVYPMRAPFAGTVVQVLKTEGESVDAGSSSDNTNAIVRIDDLSQLFVEASTPEAEISKLEIGQEAIIKASAILERTYKGKIERISLAAKEMPNWEKARVEFLVQLTVSDKDTQLKPGMSVIVDIITRKAMGVLSLRHEFVQKSGTKYYVVTESGEKKDIEVGLQNEEAFEIKSGLNEGEKVRQTDFLSILKEQ